jgi:predicted Rossmann-fold nucleotide-binding protein
MFESLTLIQTHKIRNFPVVLYGSEYWQEMLDWVKNLMLGRKMISEHDLRLLHLTDSPEHAVEIVAESQNSLSKLSADVSDDY